MRRIVLLRRAAPRARQALVPALAVLALAGAAMGQGLVQVGFGGAIGSAAPESEEGVQAGHLVEVEVGVRTRSGDARVDLHLHLASRTTGADLAAFVARRLERAGFDVTAPPGRDGIGQLWVENALFVNVRAGAGMWAEVVACEGAPAHLRVRPPDAIAASGKVTITASTASPHDGKRGVASLAIDLVPEDRAPHSAEKIHAAAQKEWVSDRPGNDAWRPVKMQNGHYLTGVSARVDSDADWRLELALPVEASEPR